jgi:hypothetical protein
MNHSLRVPLQKFGHFKLVFIGDCRFNETKKEIGFFVSFTRNWVDERIRKLWSQDTEADRGVILVGIRKTGYGELMWISQGRMKGLGYTSESQPVN